jgi:hypothetical protein
MAKEILDNAQYNNFFRNLAEIVHADFPTVADKKQALYDAIENNDPSDENVDLANLEEFISWFETESTPSNLTACGNRDQAGRLCGHPESVHKNPKDGGCGYCSCPYFK